MKSIQEWIKVHSLALQAGDYLMELGDEYNMHKTEYKLCMEYIENIIDLAYKHSQGNYESNIK